MCGGQRLASDILFLPFPTSLLDKPPTDPELIHLARLAEQRATGIFLLLHPESVGEWSHEIPGPQTHQ